MKNREENHQQWVDMWNVQRNSRIKTDNTPDDDEQSYLTHPEWLPGEYSLVVKGAWTHDDSLDLMLSEAADDAFTNAIRETIGSQLDYAAIKDRVVCLSIEI